MPIADSNQNLSLIVTMGIGDSTTVLMVDGVHEKKTKDTMPAE